MVDIEKIEAEIERLKTLDINDYLADKIEDLKNECAKEIENKIKELENALKIIAEYTVVENEAEEVIETEEFTGA